jgi:four helix bundle protein
MFPRKSEKQMNEQQFKARTKKLALRVIRLVDALPAGIAADVIGRQVLRSATSVGANYRAACRSGSDAAMIAKLNIVAEESDETLFWLELLVESGLIPGARLADLIAEADEITAMTTASLKTLRAKSRRTIKNS